MQLTLTAVVILATIGIISTGTKLNKLLFLLVTIAALILLFYVRLNAGSVVVE